MLLLVLGVASAYATVPTAPSVIVLPGVGKPYDQFQLDDAVGGHYAQQQMGVAPGEAARYGTVSTAAFGSARRPRRSPGSSQRAMCTSAP
jgi:hypothetical protein